MFTKGLKNIIIDSKQNHIYVKSTNLSLVILRPYDLLRLGDLVGSGSEDILIWAGKTIGKSLCTNIQEKNKDKDHKKLFEELLNNLNNLGYGKFQMDYKDEKSVKIQVFNSIVNEIKEKEDAKLILNLYNGIFIGSFNSFKIDVILKKITYEFEENSPSIFEYDFIKDKGEN